MTSGRVLIRVIFGEKTIMIIRKKLGLPRSPSWALEIPKSTKISLEMGNNRLYLVITTKI
jgi:hypothetical protein